MSLRWFVYWCSLLGGCAAYVGWALGKVPAVQNDVFLAAVKGMFLGMALAAGITLVDAFWNQGSSPSEILLRVLVAGLVGGLGGFMGGLIGQVLYKRLRTQVFLPIGWAFTGLLIGASPGLFDLLQRLSRNEDGGSAVRKVINGVLGGGVGGVLGGLCFLVLNNLWGAVLADRADDFWTPSATGFVALGLCIGLMIGLAQVILKEAWIKVEAGFKAGRELILSRPLIVIGRAEGCDIALFGDSGVEKHHARIRQEGGRYLLEDLDTPGGTFVNGQRVYSVTPLRAGDRIAIGRSSLLFGERQKRPEQAL